MIEFPEKLRFLFEPNQVIESIVAILLACFVFVVAYGLAEWRIRWLRRRGD